MHSGIVISQADGRPMYLQIMEQVRRRIAAGDWPPGHELPSIRQLAADLGISVITIKRSYLELEREGVIVTRHGKGSFVAERPGIGPELPAGELDRHLDEAVRLGALLGLDARALQDRLREAARRFTREDR